MAKLKIKKGDQVIVRTGKDKGRQGEVIDVRQQMAASRFRVLIW